MDDGDETGESDIEIREQSHKRHRGGNSADDDDDDDDDEEEKRVLANDSRDHRPPNRIERFALTSPNLTSPSTSSRPHTRHHHTSNQKTQRLVCIFCIPSLMI